MLDKEIRIKKERQVKAELGEEDDDFVLEGAGSSSSSGTIIVKKEYVPRR